MPPKEKFRMKPHIFAHFLPSEEFPEVTPEGFRSTGLEEATDAGRPVLYLAGDCTFFEDHLPPEETFARQLGKGLRGLRLLNAGTPHYTAQHSLHRLIVDISRGLRPAVVLFTAGANDTLSFIHHKNGRWLPDHTHLYRPWDGEFEIHRRISRLPGALLRGLAAFLFFGTRHAEWDRMAESISPVYQTEESVRAARRLFETGNYETSLSLIHNVCRGVGASLVLATFAYQSGDMEKEPRKTYAWGIDRMNQATRAFARREGLSVVDWAAAAPFGPEEILNKWHYTAAGNRRRAELTLPLLAHWGGTGQALEETASLKGGR